MRLLARVGAARWLLNESAQHYRLPPKVSSQSGIDVMRYPILNRAVWEARFFCEASALALCFPA
jgi:hypothetical protein